jgi:hypothetical protein
LAQFASRYMRTLAWCALQATQGRLWLGADRELLRTKKVVARQVYAKHRKRENGAKRNVAREQNRLRVSSAGMSRKRGAPIWGGGDGYSHMQHGDSGVWLVDFGSVDRGCCLYSHLVRRVNRRVNYYTVYNIVAHGGPYDTYGYIFWTYT